MTMLTNFKRVPACACVLAFVAFATIAGCSSQADQEVTDSDELAASPAAAHTLKISPSTLHLTPGTHQHFTVSLSGSGSGSASLTESDPPAGVTESTGIGVPVGGSTTVDLYTAPGTPLSDATQTFTAIYRGNKYRASIHLVVDTAPPTDAGAPDTGAQDGGTTDGGSAFTMSAVPSTVTIAPGGQATFKIFATGHGGSTTMNLTDPPVGIDELTTIFLPLGGSVDVSARAASSIVSEEGDQTFSADVIIGGRSVHAETTVHFSIHR